MTTESKELRNLKTIAEKAIEHYFDDIYGKGNFPRWWKTIADADYLMPIVILRGVREENINDPGWSLSWKLELKAIFGISVFFIVTDCKTKSGGIEVEVNTLIGPPITVEELEDRIGKILKSGSGVLALGRDPKLQNEG